MIRNLSADVITAGRLWSKDRKTYIDLDTGEIVSVADDGTKVVVRKGQISVINSVGVERVGIMRAGDDNHYVVGLNDNSGGFAGGVGVFGDQFAVFAYDGNQISGGPTRWKTIDGVQYLVREGW